MVVQTAPSIRAAIGEGFGLPPGTPATGKMVTALRRLGFDAVFDTDFGADLTIVEEAHEFLTRLKEGPAADDHLLLAGLDQLPGEVLSRADPARLDLPLADEHALGAGQDLLRRAEGHRPGEDLHGGRHAVRGQEVRGPPARALHGPTACRYTDAVLTTRELIWMIKCYGIDFATLPDGEFDAPLGMASGAGDIFGTTGGVMEATLRAASELVTGKPADRLEFTEVRAVEGLRETYVAIGEHNIHVGVANGLTNAKILLDKVIAGKEQFHVIEVMACPGGCIGGGGQPYPPEGVKVLDPRLLRKRAGALYAIDSGKTLRKSYENPAIEEVYDDVPGRARARKRPTSCCTPTTTPNCREASDEHRHRRPPPTDNWADVEAAGPHVLGEPIVASSSTQCRRGPEPREPADRRAAPGAGRSSATSARRTWTPWPSSCRCPAAKVAGVASFYHFFRLQPRGKFIINVCLGTACYVKGADRVAQKLMDELGITLGETSNDGMFTLERPAAWAPAAWPRC